MSYGTNADQRKQRASFGSIKTSFSPQEFITDRSKAVFLPWFFNVVGREMIGIGSSFHQLCTRYSGILTPTALTAIWLLEAFIFDISEAT